jgi:hypothetical protein
LLEAVTDDERVLGNSLLLVQLANDLKIVRVRSFQVNFVLERFFQHKREMAALGAIAVHVFSFILMFFHGVGEHLLGLPYLHTYLGQIGKLHGSAILCNERFKVKAVKLKIVVMHVKSFLGEIERLVNEV